MIWEQFQVCLETDVHAVPWIPELVADGWRYRRSLRRAPQPRAAGSKSRQIIYCNMDKVITIMAWRSRASAERKPQWNRHTISFKF